MEKVDKENKTPFAFLWSVIKPYRYYYALMAMAPVAAGLYSILYHYAIKLLLDVFTQKEVITYGQAIWPIFWFISAQVILSGSWRLHNYAQLKTIPYIFQRLMDRICRHVFYLPYTYFQNNLSGSISAKMRGIGDKYYSMHQSLEFKLGKPFFATIFSAITLALVHLEMFLLISGFFILHILFSTVFFKKLAKLEQSRQDAWYVLFGTIADRVQNIANIFSFATREKEISHIEKFYNDDLIPLGVRYFRYDIFVSIVFDILYVALLLFIFFWTIHLRNSGQISIGDIAFIISLTLLLVENLWETTMGMRRFLEDVAAFRSAFSLMQVPKCSIDSAHATAINIGKGDIVFKDICFSYEDGLPIFSNLNLHIQAGQKVGLVGSSGAGKSSLIALLLKNFNLKQGHIYIDGQDLESTLSNSLRAQISVIPQDITLFHRSIGENIGYANEKATQEDIVAAAKMANIHDFIAKLPQSYETLVGEKGIKLSGGQRQRIAIARAILKKARIIILDEATSSLDSQTEYDIQQSLHSLLETHQATVIAIAHRLSTIKHMDRIIVMNQGKIIEDGHFSELTRLKNGKFKELWEHQINGMIV